MGSGIDRAAGLSNCHDLSRNLIRIWIEKYQAGAPDEDVAAADLLQADEARIAALERRDGSDGKPSNWRFSYQPSMSLTHRGLPAQRRGGVRSPDLSGPDLWVRPTETWYKGGSTARTPFEKRADLRDHRPSGLDIAVGCRLMGLARSTFYDGPTRVVDDTANVEAIATICDAFEHYSYRRVQATLRQNGLQVNHTKVRRLMREHDLQPKMRRCVIKTTDRDHDQAIFSNLAKEASIDSPDRLWVADITYVTIIGSFVYVAVILDA